MASSLEVSVLPAESKVDSELDAFMAECPSSFAQQTPSWRNVITGIDRDEPRFLGCREGGKLVGVLPAYRFEGPLGAILTSLPQAGPLGGVACHPAADRERVYAALLEAYLELAVSTRCELATVIRRRSRGDHRMIRSVRSSSFANCVPLSTSHTRATLSLMVARSFPSCDQARASNLQRPGCSSVRTD